MKKFKIFFYLKQVSGSKYIAGPGEDYIYGFISLNDFLNCYTDIKINEIEFSTKKEAIKWYTDFFEKTRNEVLLFNENQKPKGIFHIKEQKEFNLPENLFIFESFSL